VDPKAENIFIVKFTKQENLSDDKDLYNPVNVTEMNSPFSMLSECMSSTVVQSANPQVLYQFQHRKDKISNAVQAQVIEVLKSSCHTFQAPQMCPVASAS